MRDTRQSLLIATGLLLVPMLAVGCSQPDDGIPPAEKQQANRFNEIAKASGGDWDKLSEADRQYLIKEIAHGNEQSARMMLAAKTGRLRGAAGGPPGGPPRNSPGGPQPR
jgi:hypothetical protein